MSDKKRRAASTAPKQHRLVPYQFKKGQSGNPKGREKGSRNKLGEQFIQDLFEFWQEHGPVALRYAATKDPAGVVRTVASLLPKEVTIRSPVDSMTDEQLLERIRALGSELGFGELFGTAAESDGQAPRGPNADRGGGAPPVAH
jgi:hypothetical protein